MSPVAPSCGVCGEGPVGPAGPPGPPGAGGGAYDLGSYFNQDNVTSIDADGSSHGTNSSVIQSLVITNPSATDSMIVIAEFHAPSIAIDWTGNTDTSTLRDIQFYIDNVLIDGNSNILVVPGPTADPLQRAESNSTAGRIILAPSQSVSLDILDTFIIDYPGVSIPLSVTLLQEVVGEGWSMNATGWVAL